MVQITSLILVINSTQIYDFAGKPKRNTVKVYLLKGQRIKKACKPQAFLRI
jgi:hypothetical protein